MYTVDILNELSLPIQLHAFGEGSPLDYRVQQEAHIAFKVANIKVALFVDHIYSKICYLFLVLGIGFLCATIYLYIKLPNVIPVHWGSSFKVDSWGRKETLFILPVSLFVCLMLSIKKFIHAHETNPFRIMAAELIVLGVLTLLVIAMSYVYPIYFSLL